jgi:hypothetical protein
MELARPVCHFFSKAAAATLIFHRYSTLGTVFVKGDLTLSRTAAENAPIG